MKTVRIRITGKVQGVFYRASAKKMADSMQLAGWVRNLDEDVVVVVSGKEKDIEAFLHWCQKGPENAIVEDVLSEEIPYQDFHGFSIVR